MEAKVDVVVMDSAHGHSANVLRTVDMVKSTFPELQVIAGNVATAAAAEALIKAGADAVKVGPGLYLHHPRGGGNRSSSDHCGDGLL